MGHGVETPPRGSWGSVSNKNRSHFLECNIIHHERAHFRECILYYRNIQQTFETSGQIPRERAAVCCSVLQCVAVCCSVSQCVAVCRNVSQCVAVCCSVSLVCCSVLQYAAVCCSVLQCVADFSESCLARECLFGAVAP